MKVVSPQVMAEAERAAYAKGCVDNDFMEAAGKGVAATAEAFVNEHALAKKVWLLCGKGNNGGDTFVAGCYLLTAGYSVQAIFLSDFSDCSPLCQKNATRFKERGGIILRKIPDFGSVGIILDGLFGTGFRGRVEPPFDALINAANASLLPILAVDIPSGLNGTTGEVDGAAINATATLYLGLPKSGFFLGEGWNVCGKLLKVDFGMPESCIAVAKEDFFILTKEAMGELLPPVIRNRHKYQAGLVVGLAGSKTMPGAALLTSLAALRGGCGMVRLLYPEEIAAELSASPYEVIKIPYRYNQQEEIVATLKKGKGVFVGPGLGSSEEVDALICSVVPTLSAPCVIDADALSCYAKKPFAVPSGTIFTPHHGEMQRLLHADEPLRLDLKLLRRLSDYAKERHITLIYKGAPTFIFHPDGNVFVNPTGDPGMATAGSGDVLTGLLAALLAQGVKSEDASLLGVYLHGLAGEIVRRERGVSYGMIASDLIAHFADAFRLC